MNLFTVYSDKELELLSKLPELTKKKIIHLEDISLFSTIKGSLNLIQKREIELKKAEIFKTGKIIYVVEGEVGVMHLREIVKRVKKNELFGVKNFLKKRDFSIIALKDSLILEIEIDLTPSKELSKVLIEFCKIGV